MRKGEIYLLIKDYKTALSVLGTLVLLYSLLPVCIGERFVFPNQIHVVVMMAYIAILISVFLLFKAITNFQNAEIQVSNIDIVLFIYAIYNTCIYLFHYKNIHPEVLFESFSLFIFYILFRNIKTKYIVYLLLVFPITGVVQIIYGIKKQANNFAPGYGFSDVIGIFHNPGIFGGFIAIVFVLTLGMAISMTGEIVSKFKKQLLQYFKFLLVLVLILLLVQLIKSNSRAAWCACIAGSLYFIGSHFGLFGRFLELSLFKKLLFTVLSISLICVLLSGFYELKKDSANGRILIWKISSDMINDKPLFGHGPAGFQSGFMEYQAAYFKIHSHSSYSYLADDNNYAFNEFIRIWIEQGSVGLLLSLILLYNLFFNTKGKRKDINTDWNLIAIKASFMSLLVFGFFSYPMSVFQFNLLIIFFIAIISTHSIIKTNIRIDCLNYLLKSKEIYVKALMIGFVLMWFIVVTGLIRITYNYAAACKQWNVALRDFSETEASKSIDMLKISYSQLKNDGVFLSTYGKALNLSGQYTEAIQIFTRANHLLPSAANYIELGKSYKEIGRFVYAKNAWIKASNMVPSMFGPYYLTAKMYYQIGKTTDAQHIANCLLRKEVKIRNPALNEMLAEMDSIVKIHH